MSNNPNLPQANGPTVPNSNSVLLSRLDRLNEERAKIDKQINLIHSFGEDTYPINTVIRLLSHDGDGLMLKVDDENWISTFFSGKAPWYYIVEDIVMYFVRVNMPVAITVYPADSAVVERTITSD